MSLILKGENLTKRLICYMIIAMSISLAFSGGKPCCNKKAGENAVNCKFNQATLEIDKETEGEASVGGQIAYKCCTDTGNQCFKSTNKPWWKFWVKKSTKNCACKQADAKEDASAG